MQLLRLSTVTTLVVGPVLDSAGAPITSAVIGDFSIAKNGTTSALAAAATATSVGNGYYQIALIAGNVDTAGRFVVFVNNAAQSMGTHMYTVLLASVFDAIITNATNTAGGLPAATGAISALTGAISTFAGGAVASVTGAVGSVTGLTVANLDATISSRMATYTQPTGFLAATFPGGTVANTTNITAGTIATVTTLTNLPAIPTNWLTAAGIAADAITAAKIADNAIDTATFAAGTTIPRVTLADTLTTYTGNTAQTGDSFARIGATGSGLTTLATAAQIPANFTTGTFVSAGVFATAALANAPSGTGASAASIRAEMDANSTRLANLDATTSSRMASYTQPTGFLAATFPATVASPTNITGGTITTATNLTNLPAIPTNWLTAAGIAAAALDGKGNWNVGKSGYALTVTTGLGNQTANITGNVSGSIGSVTGAVGSVTGLTVGNLDATVSSRSTFAGGAVASVTGGVTVTTNNDKTGYALTTGIPTAVANADALLGRNLAGGSDGGRTVRDAMRAARNRVSFDVPAVGQFTVFAEDDTTAAWTGTYTAGTASTFPVVTMDPA